MQTCFLYVAFKLLCADLLVIAEWLVRNHRNEAGHGQWDVRSNAGKHKCIQGCTSAPCRFAMGNWPCIQEPGPGAPKVTKVHESFFPMYLVKACRSVVERESPPPRNDFKVQSHAKVSDFLAMEGVPESHDRLKQRGLLHEYNPSAGMFTIFVSHQWLGRKHPDPTGEQVSVLRTTLKRLIDGSLMIDLDLVSTHHGQQNRFTPQTRQQVETGFLFFDWFAIPQITARAEGVNEEVTKSDAARAVKSIPSYVEVASLFIALVPFVPDRDRQEWCSYTTWLARGWCRRGELSTGSPQCFGTSCCCTGRHRSIDGLPYIRLNFSTSRPCRRSPGQDWHSGKVQFREKWNHKRGKATPAVAQSSTCKRVCPATLHAWCRAELWLHMLSSKPDTSVILVTSVTEAKFMFPLDWLESLCCNSGTIQLAHSGTQNAFWQAKEYN